MKSAPALNRWRLPAALVVAVLVGAGCGSTRSERELAGFGGADSLLAADVGTTPDAGVQSGEPIASAAAGVADPGSATTEAQARTDSGPSKALASTPGGSMGTGTATPGSKPGSGSGRASTAPAAPTVPVSGSKPEIVLGEIGNLSGIPGQTLIPTVHAARAWVADVNARGGLNGHRVRLVVGDDGGDPARALALARRMVDEDHVSAFYAQSMVLTLQAVLPFIEEKKIPIIGGCNCTPVAAGSPMVFEVGTSPDVGMAAAFAAPVVGYSTERRVSLFRCREVAGCSHGADNIKKKIAPAIGLEIVHEAQASLAQPDFTAEVLAARNAGAKAIIVYMDNPSLLRIKRSADRQGWRPMISTAWSSLDERFLELGGQDAEGMLVGSPMTTWLSPRMADYVAAMGRHVPGGIKAGVGITAWAGGKLIERVAATLPDGQVAGADFLRGLYTLRNETLGGIVPPVTFQEGKARPEDTCFVLVRVEKGRYVSKDGDNLFCPLAPR